MNTTVSALAIIGSFTLCAATFAGDSHASLDSMIKKMDADQNGTLSAAEIKTGHEKMMRADAQ